MSVKHVPQCRCSPPSRMPKRHPGPISPACAGGAGGLGCRSLRSASLGGVFRAAAAGAARRERQRVPSKTRRRPRCAAPPGCVGRRRSLARLASRWSASLDALSRDPARRCVVSAGRGRRAGRLSSRLGTLLMRSALVIISFACVGSACVSGGAPCRYRRRVPGRLVRSAPTASAAAGCWHTRDRAAAARPAAAAATGGGTATAAAPLRPAAGEPKAAAVVGTTGGGTGGRRRICLEMAAPRGDWRGTSSSLTRPARRRRFVLARARRSPRSTRRLSLAGSVSRFIGGDVTALLRRSFAGRRRRRDACVASDCSAPKLDRAQISATAPGEHLRPGAPGFGSAQLRLHSIKRQCAGSSPGGAWTRPRWPVDSGLATSVGTEPGVTALKPDGSLAAAHPPHAAPCSSPAAVRARSSVWPRRGCASCSRRPVDGDGGKAPISDTATGQPIAPARGAALRVAERAVTSTALFDAGAGRRRGGRRVWSGTPASTVRRSNPALGKAQHPRRPLTTDCHHAARRRGHADLAAARRGAVADGRPRRGQR